MDELPDINRTATGIIGFDRLIQGGIPQNFNILVAGNPGTGKSIFSLKFIYEGAMNNEPGLYVTLDETKENILSQSAQFGWDFERLEKKNMVRIESIKLSSIDETLKFIKTAASEIKAERIVIDSISTLFELTAMYQEIYHRIYESKPMNPFTSSQSKVGSVKKNIYTIFNKLRGLNCTILSISEAVIGSDNISRDGISEFVCDGIIFLNSVSMGQSVTRTVEIKKMRQTELDGGVHFFDFDKDGISMHS